MRTALCRERHESSWVFFGVAANSPTGVLWGDVFVEMAIRRDCVDRPDFNAKQEDML